MILPDSLNCSRKKREYIVQNRIAAAMEVAEKWFSYNEYLGVEFDTDTGEIRVLTSDEY